MGAVLEAAPPPFYLVYLLSAGLGLPCSEDALIAWVGANIARQKYGGTAATAGVLALIYAGVVASDMVTFAVGVLVRRGLLSGLKESLLKDSRGLERALAMIRRWSRSIGAVQRFSLGFRGPLCLVCGFTGMPARDFLGGVALGALGTMPLQLFVGYLLRDSPSPYLAALAIAAGPNACGHLAGPVLAAVGVWWARYRGGSEGSPGGGEPEPPAAAASPAAAG